MEKNLLVFASTFAVVCTIWILSNRITFLQKLSTYHKKYHRQRLDFSVDKPKRPFVGIHLGLADRAGNRLFSLASSIGIAMKNDLNLRIMDNFEEIFNTFRINDTLKIKSLQHGEKFEEFLKREETYDNSTDRLKFSPDNHRLSGYYNSFRYFYDILDIIRTSFRPNQDLDDRVSKFLDSNTPPSPNFIRIGVHIRRGDFLTAPLGYTVADERYFTHAMNYMQNRFGGQHIQYVVISDDMEYARRTINATDVIFSDFSEPLEDMALVSKADHAIISTGTFSWWCGFLTGGVVVYYKNYPAKGSKLDEVFRAEDAYLPDWIAME